MLLMVKLFDVGVVHAVHVDAVDGELLFDVGVVDSVELLDIGAGHVDAVDCEAFLY